MVRGVHPEFGYLCLSPNLRRKLWLASVACALVGASGLGMFMTRAIWRRWRSRRSGFRAEKLLPPHQESPKWRG